MGPLEGIWPTLSFSYPCNQETKAQEHYLLQLPEVLSFETLLKCASQVACTRHLQSSSLRICQP